MSAPLLEVQELEVSFVHRRAVRRAIDRVTFSVERGRTLGIVGESGCGKSLTALAIMGLLPTPPARVDGGRIFFSHEGTPRDLLRLKASGREMRAIRGREIAMIFQEPMTALNPVMRVGDQIAEALLVHGKASQAEARARAAELLDAVKIADAPRRVRDYPHQLSGGMRQRVMIAIALAQVLELLRELKARYNLALLLITHDFGVIAEMADHVAVMYQGRLVEHGSVREVLRHPSHAYTRNLLAAVPGTR
jgi:ABC-type dipeptide/oligopeptide/nickel transport system ATPase component